MGPAGRRLGDGAGPRPEGSGRRGLPPRRGRHDAAALRRPPIGRARAEGGAGRCRHRPPAAGEAPGRPTAAWLGRNFAGRGRSLDHAIVESAENNLALAANRSAGQSGPVGDWSRLGRCLETLKDHYEMVLVDLGPLEDNEPIGEVLARAAGGNIDAFLLVHDRAHHVEGATWPRSNRT